MLDREQEEPRIGVFVCHCGLNIAGVVDVEAVTEYAKTLPGVVHAEHNTYTCSEPGQKAIKEAIKKYKLNRVVVASCSPRMHEPTFRQVIQEAGLNPYVLEMANIREHCSWCHPHEPEKATEKAKDLVRMAVAKARLLRPLEPIRVPVGNCALVIGGGIAGITAALNLAEMGYKVYLVDRYESIGGHMAQLDKTFPTLDCSICIEGPLMVDVYRHPNVELITYAEVKAVEGYVGNFRVLVEKKPRYVIEERCTGCGECRDACPIEVPNDWDMFLGVRKAIDVPFDQAVPLVYRIDRDHCIECYKCVEACGPRQAIDFSQEPEEVELQVGAIIVATGFDIYLPYDDPRYGYGRYDNVITALEMERLHVAAGPTRGVIRRASDGRVPRSVAFIQCVGSRDITRFPYCSGICCMYSLKNAILLKEKHPDTEVYVLYTDMRTNFKGYEEFFNRAKEMGIKFFRVDLEERQIEEDPATKNLIIRAKREDGSTLELEVEMVVLATAMVPKEGAKDLARLLGLSVGPDGFFLEAHPKLRPVETLVDGIFLAGCCQGPKDIQFSVAQGAAAAVKAAEILSKPELQIEPLVAVVDEERCRGCGRCEEVCEFGAISVVEREGRLVASVNEAVCKGCGACSVRCPTGAVRVQHFRPEQIRAQAIAATGR